MTIPYYLTKENYMKSRELINEAIIARNRAYIIYIVSNLLHYNDIHGFIEALQHCLELYLKALWVLVGLKYPHDHNPAKDIEVINTRLIEVMPWLNNEPFYKEWEQWIKEKSKYYSSLHHKTIYGDEKTGIVASKYFTKEDGSKINRDVHFVISFLSGAFLQIGALLETLSEKEREKLQADIALRHELDKLGLDEILRKVIHTYLDYTRTL